MTEDKIGKYFERVDTHARGIVRELASAGALFRIAWPDAPQMAYLEYAEGSGDWVDTLILVEVFKGD